MNNLHISLTRFRNESRILKQTHSLISSGTVSAVHVAAITDSRFAEVEESSNNVNIRRFALKSKHWGSNFLAQTIKYSEFCFRVWLYYRKSSIQLINIHSLSLLPLGVFLKFIYRAQLVYDTHELETETDGLRGMRKILAKILEKQFIRRVDLVFVVSEHIADWYARTYEISRPTVILNAPRRQVPARTDIFRETFDIRTDQTIFLYQGGLAESRGVRFILEAFQQRTDNDAVVVFMGYGELEDEIRAASENFNHIYFQTAVRPEKLLNYTAAADVGIHMIRNTCLNHYYCMPNKLFEYSMAGLAVLVSNMKEMAEFVNKYETGFVLEEESNIKLNGLIDRILLENLDRLKRNAAAAGVANSWELQEEKMLSAYGALLQ